MSISILLVGCGKMGGAMLSGWLEHSVSPEAVVVVEPNGVEETTAKVVASADAVPDGFRPDVVVLAVKPQMMDDVAPAFARFASDKTVFLSIAAGRTLASLRRAVGADEAVIVRAMPNTPSAVGRGMTVCCPGEGVTDAMRDTCTMLLEAVGQVAWVDDEAQMDAVTAVSGSGPAYVFALTEAMAAAGEKAGLPANLAAMLARATVCGAGELMYRASEDPAQLRENVTSPGGTTAAALDVLRGEDGFPALLEKAVAAAARRSKELAG
ncbi:Pyrroline-5-carboxylate reductase [Caenispirillum salinarum AK4]|uniref:Pyrroline-5-carboxylate reductase n=1 Tax=Caenispirillum salinarum AK4 TaxID=1238182 RepID=K9HEI6_9PROT|nr:pyrroline-5-carboxylate reductase [Caenispirillum salinarum]EKV27086.1 Pyrroline-5-carboxylate reductase [Caenispirillum salinarum AK4]